MANFKGLQGDTFLSSSHQSRTPYAFKCPCFYFQTAHCRSLWAKVLGAVKEYTERKLADIDMTAFWDAFSPVCEIQLSPENRADHLKKIQHLLELLKAFGSVESRFSQAQAEEKSRFDEKIAALKDWFQRSFQPNIPQINGVLVGWISAAEPEKGDNMDERAKAFKPVQFRLPPDLDDTFNLQCDMS